MRKLRIEIRFAFIYSFVLILWMWLEKLIGLHDRFIDKQLLYTNLFAIPGFVIFFLAIRQKREDYFGGRMLWTQGFVSGTFLAAFIAVLSPLYNAIIYGVISPDYFSTMIRYVTTNNLPAKQNADLFFSLKSYILQSSLSGISFGIMASAIAALILRREK